MGLPHWGTRRLEGLTIESQVPRDRLFEVLGKVPSERTEDDISVLHSSMKRLTVFGDQVFPPRSYVPSFTVLCSTIMADLFQAESVRWYLCRELENYIFSSELVRKNTPRL